MTTLSYDDLEDLLGRHPGWRLLRSDHAPMAGAFFHRMFVEGSERGVPEPVLVEALEDELFRLREDVGEGAYPRSALDYLNDWAAPEKGWLRKYYRAGDDEACFDLAPAAERAVAWLASLKSRPFVGTESRLLTVFELLRQMVAGTETDPGRRLEDLRRRREEIDAEIARVAGGEIPLLDDTGLRDRFQQFAQTAREILGDFREVEQNFRLLDRQMRERITLWEGSKAGLLEEMLGERDAIAGSDQGRSFHAFWDFLMSGRRQEELTGYLEAVLDHPAIRVLEPDPRLRRIHYDWLQAGEHTQRTVADLSRQLRVFLDDQTWLENRRIMELLRGIESKAIEMRETPPKGTRFMEMEESAASVVLPFERPLHRPPFQVALADAVLEGNGEEIDAGTLFAVRLVDKAALTGHIRKVLQDRGQITLRELVELRPLEYGLAEVVAYLDLGSGSFRARIDENSEDTLTWRAEDSAGEPIERRVRFPRVIFVA